MLTKKDLNKKIIKVGTDKKPNNAQKDDFYVSIYDELLAAEKLVMLSTGQEVKQKSPVIPSIEEIGDLLGIYTSNDEYLLIKIQNLIHWCISGDLSFIKNNLRDEMLDFQIKNSTTEELENYFKFYSTDSKELVNDYNFYSETKQVNDCNFYSESKDVNDKTVENKDLVKNKVADKNKSPNDNRDEMYKIRFSSSKKNKLICQNCESTFTTRNGLKYHITFVHSEKNEKAIKPYLCPFSDKCKKKYKNKNGLYYHLRHYHKEVNEDIEDLYARSVDANCIMSSKPVEK
ncbi:uncharacterized protein VNE69_03227 [Vairimorpha necatrix]|uniref:C2H2-type domain-containing protein n=1 Tax=Vairimorpha necatrix TaxID=6039 RepID=A0AAX4JAL3_9MICR